MPTTPASSTRSGLHRSTCWHGVRQGDPVVVNTPRERRLRWIFVAHVLNESSGEEWVEVRGGREGEMKGRSFRAEVIFPLASRRGARVVGLSLADAPQFNL